MSACAECGQSFKAKTLSAHERQCNGFVCCYCDKQFLGSNYHSVTAAGTARDNHQASHRATHECENCGQEFTGERHASLRERNDHQKSCDGFECDFCDKCFAGANYSSVSSARQARDNHQSSHSEFECDKCEKIFQVSRYLSAQVAYKACINHEKDCKSEAQRWSENYFDSSSDSDSSDFFSPISKTQNCQDCGKTFYSESSTFSRLTRDEHQRDCPGFPCIYCGKCFPGTAYQSLSAAELARDNHQSSHESKLNMASTFSEVYKQNIDKLSQLAISSAQKLFGTSETPVKQAQAPSSASTSSVSHVQSALRPAVSSFAEKICPSIEAQPSTCLPPLPTCPSSSPSARLSQLATGQPAVHPAQSASVPSASSQAVASHLSHFYDSPPHPSCSCASADSPYSSGCRTTNTEFDCKLPIIGLFQNSVQYLNQCSVLEYLRVVTPQNQNKWESWVKVLAEADIDTVGDLRSIADRDFETLTISVMLRSALRKARDQDSEALRSGPPVYSPE